MLALPGDLSGILRQSGCFEILVTGTDGSEMKCYRQKSLRIRKEIVFLNCKQSPVIMDSHCLRTTQSGKSHDHRDYIVFEKLRFRDGLAWTVCLTVEIKLPFLNFSCVMWTVPDMSQCCRLNMRINFEIRG